MTRSKTLVFYLLLYALLCLSLGASAEVARDITGECHVLMNQCNNSSARMQDRDAQTASTTGALIDPYVKLTVGETPLAAIYMSLGKNVLPFEVQVQEGKKWVTVAESTPEYSQTYLAFDPIPSGTKVRLVFRTGKQYKLLSIREIYLFSEGEISPIVHQWQPPVENADLMVVVAHPDDELLWLGGTIPYYAGELDMDVCVTYLTCSNSMRQAELLDGIWHCGVRNYPEICYFKDVKLSKISSTYEAWGGQEKTLRELAARIRRYKPEVIVTHAIDGEYGHYAHRTCANAMQKVIDLSADPSFDPASAEKYGAWQVKKLYLHKDKDDLPLTVMDWRQPLDFFGGKTAYDVAVEAYNFHGSQPHSPGFYEVADENDEHNSFIYTLVYSTVGPDVQGGDFFENIDREAPIND